LSVEGDKNERDGFAGDRRAVAEIAHQCFGGMRQRFEPRQCKKATGPFNRVNEAKDVAENLGVVRILLEANQLCIDNVKAFARLREKFAQQFVHELGLSAQHAKERTGGTRRSGCYTRRQCVGKRFNFGCANRTDAHISVRLSPISVRIRPSLSRSFS
jgi:hypothetical protein